MGPVYVSGYLALYDRDGGELALTREIVAAALPPAGPLPINIDHRARCDIGAVLAVVDDDRGPFFLGVVNCPQLGAVLARAVAPDFFGDMRPSDEERLLYLLSNYLPSASLSSRRLPGDAPDETLFAHVALCVIGRRVGTIVVYDASPERAVGPFRELSAGRSELLARAAESPDAERVWHMSEDALTRALLSTAVNNMLLRDRWELVAERRREAGVRAHTYLQATMWAGLLPKSGASPGARAQCGHGSPAERTPGDYIFVPAAQYNQLVVNQRPAPSLESQLGAIVSAAMDRRHRRSPSPEPRPPARKRRYDDYAQDNAYYPGEAPPPRATSRAVVSSLQREISHLRAQHVRYPTPYYAPAPPQLLPPGAVVGHPHPHPHHAAGALYPPMYAPQPGLHAPPPSPVAHAVPALPGLPASRRCGPVAHVPAQVVPQQPVVVQAQPVAVPAAAPPPLRLQQRHAPAAPVQAAAPRAPASAPQPPVQASVSAPRPTESPPAPIDASSAAVACQRGADIFVSQMMSQR
nr:viral proteinase - rabies virus [Lyssavirus rabies]